MKRFLGLILALLLVIVPVQAQAVQMDIPAKGVLLMDVNTGTVLYEQNSHDALPIASVTKVMTMLLIMEAIDSGKIGWQDQVTASETAAAKGGSQIYLKVGETMTVADMVKSIAVSSANDCACAMAEHIAGSEAAFVEMMNAKAKALGMNDTKFVNCTGLDDAAEASEHKSSAHDVALMSRELLKNHPDISQYTTIWMDTVRNGEFGLSNTNKLVRFYNGATGLKTGFTRAAGYCLSASAKRDDLHLVAVVLGSETSQERFSACKSLLDYGFANFCIVTPTTEEQTVPVKLGTADSVVAVPATTEGILLDKSQQSLASCRVELEESVTAPVAQGQRLGTLYLQAGEQVLAEIPLLAKEAVPKLTWGQIFLRLLKQLSMKG